MAKFLVQNGAPLYGVVQISGAKNAVLPEMASAILTKEKCKISDVPNLIDVKVMKDQSDRGKRARDKYGRANKARGELRTYEQDACIIFADGTSSS